jgi:hypothetical protein
LSREDVVQASHTLLGIALAGVKVVTLNNGLSFDRDAQLVDVVLAVAEITRSHQESAEKGRKVAEAHGESKRRAREEGVVWNKTGPGWLRFNEAERKFEPIPERVTVLNRIFKMAADHGMGTTVIAQRLNREGIQPFKGGKKWHGTTVNKMLRSQAAIGNYQPRFADGSPDGELALGYFGTPSVEPALFYRVQALLDANRRPGKRPSGDECRNLFRGLCRCAECGGNMRLHRRSKDKVDLYECYGMNLGTCFNRTRFKVRELESFVLDHIVELPLGDTQRDDAPRRRLEAVTAERDELSDIVDRLTAALERGDVGAEDRFAKHYRSRAAELEAKEAEVLALKNALEASKAVLGPLERQSQIRVLRERLSTLQGVDLFDARSRLATTIHSVVDHVTFYQSGHITLGVLGQTYLQPTVNVRAPGGEKHPSIEEVRAAWERAASSNGKRLKIILPKGMGVKISHDTAVSRVGKRDSAE